MARERYAWELEAMLETAAHLEAVAPSEPRPLFRLKATDEENDSIARDSWEKYMSDYSHGLSVSDFPKWLFFKGAQLVALPAEAVSDPKEWNRCTSIVHRVLEQWKEALQVEVDRIGREAKPTGEDVQHLALNRLVLEEFAGFDGWNYASFVEGFLPGRKPQGLDIENPRLYRAHNGLQVPVGNLRDTLRVGFWRRLLEIWDGPPNKRADHLRALLDHHHRHAPKPEVFRDLVKDTIRLLRKLVEIGRSRAGVVFQPNRIYVLSHTERWDPLAEKMDGWLQRASAPSPSAKQAQPLEMSFEREAAAQFAQFRRDELPGFSICPFPLLFSLGTRETYPNVEPGIEATDAGVRNVANWPGIDEAVRKSVAKKLPNVELRDRLSGWSYASLVPDGIPNSYDIPNPRQYLLDGSVIPSDRFIIRGRLSKAANDSFAAFQRQLNKAWTSPINLRKAKVVEFLERHFVNGDNSSAFVDFIETAGPSMSTNGKTKWHNYEEALQKELAAWVVSARKRLGSPAKPTTKAKAEKLWPDLKCLALFYAYRWEVEGMAVDFTTVDQADTIATEARLKSGKTLLEHYRRYTTGTPENRRIERTKEGDRPGDVLKRFDTVIAKLAPHAEALALATEEWKIVRNRSNRSED